MIVERSMHPSWLSNAYLLADREGGTAVFVDSGAPLEPLFEAVDRHGVTPTHLLVTHGHADHVAGNDELVERFGLQVTTGAVDTGDLHISVHATPGHSDDGVSFVVGDLCFSGDTLFKDAVGGGPADEMRRSVMDVLMSLPHELRVLPGHTDETTIGREWEENPFIRFWRGLAEERVAGEHDVPDHERDAVVRMPGRREHFDVEAAGLDRTGRNLEAVALDELVVAGDVVGVIVGDQEMRRRDAFALHRRDERLERRAAVDEHRRAARLVREEERVREPAGVHAPLDEHQTFASKAPGFPPNARTVTPSSPGTSLRRWLGPTRAKVPGVSSNDSSPASSVAEPSNTK